MAKELALRIARWPNARDTLERVEGAIRNRPLAVATLLDRIRAGLIQTAAMSCFRKEEKGSGGIQRSEPDGAVLIPPSHWAAFPDIQTVAELAFWQTGDITFEWEERASFSAVTIKYFGVRFDPKGIADMIESAGVDKPKRPSGGPPPPSLDFLSAFSRPEQPTPADVDAEQKGPPVAPEHLRAWYELYRRVYTGAADTEATALASARGMFPGKSVSRDRIRELRGTQKRGRKPDDSAK
jgi:hypothetical protein